MNQTSAGDGVRLVWHSDGRGPPLLLVHGTGTTGDRWLPVRAAFAEHFSVHAIDRRGYGASGDAPAYSMAQECRDIAACIAAIGCGPVDVVGHSYGAVCALGAAWHAASIRRLVLYEPPIPSPANPYYPADLIPRMRGAIDRGDYADAVVEFLTRAQGLDEETIRTMQRLSAWKNQVAMAPLMLRELEAVDRMQLPTSAVAGWRIPTMILLGGDSAPRYATTAAALAAVLPGCAIEVLPGQQHGAINAAPGLFADTVLRFLLNAEPAFS